MRPTPSWRALKTRHKKQPGKPAPLALLASASAFGDFSEGTGRFQCGAIAKGTGERCRRDCIGGQRRCKSHGGINGALATARAKGERLVLASDRGLIRAMRFREKLGKC
jgi:hypothetical protein